MKQVRVALRGNHLARAGPTHCLQFEPGLRTLREPGTAEAAVLALAARRMIAPHVADLRRDGSRTRVVLVVDEITEQELFLAISLHVTSILREIDVVRLIKEIAACAVLLAGALPGSTAATADSPNAQPRTANAGGFWQPTRHFPELT